MFRRAFTLGVVFAILLLPSALPLGAQVRDPRLSGSVRFAPIPVKTSAGMVLAYELHLANRDNRELTLTRLEVLKRDGTVIWVGEGGVLQRHLSNGVSAGVPEGRSVLPPGSWAVAWLWVTVPDDVSVPGLLRHRLTVAFEDQSGAHHERTLEVGNVAPGSRPTVLGSPFGEGLWLASNISNTSGHRRAIEVTGTISQRFAIDYFRVDDFGRNRTSDLFVNENHFAFGSPVLAVADGVVLAAADSMAENSVGRQPRRSFPATFGNFVELEIGPGIYASYLHLQSGSVTVEAGDRVEQGQVIGRLGNTGASIAPHLHFQLNKSFPPEGRTVRGETGEGLPFVFASYQLVW